jgi:hypothetical protein
VGRQRPETLGTDQKRTADLVRTRVEIKMNRVRLSLARRNHPYVDGDRDVSEDELHRPLPRELCPVLYRQGHCHSSGAFGPSLRVDEQASTQSGFLPALNDRRTHHGRVSLIWDDQRERGGDLLIACEHVRQAPKGGHADRNQERPQHHDQGGT